MNVPSVIDHHAIKFPLFDLFYNANITNFTMIDF